MKWFEVQVLLIYFFVAKRWKLNNLMTVNNYMINNKFVFKNKIKIVNAVVAAFKGHPMRLQDACGRLNQYIAEHNLQPITVGYNVTKKTDMLNLDNTEVDVYVGISPNIL